MTISDMMRAVFQRFVPEKVRHTLYKKYCFARSDIIVVSFPKSGRTWLRVMLGEYLRLHFDIEVQHVVDIHKLAEYNSRVPRIYFTHDDSPHKKTSDQLSRRKRKYRRKRVVLLVRDPLDVLVSLYHHKRYRNCTYADSLESYCQQDVGNLEVIVEFLNIWCSESPEIDQFLLVRYEDLHHHPSHELKRLLRFCGLTKLNSDYVQAAIAKGSFESMTKIEDSNTSGSNKLSVVNPDDRRSRKVRSGRIGSYAHSLPADLCDASRIFVKNNLEPMLGYPFAMEDE